VGSGKFWATNLFFSRSVRVRRLRRKITNLPHFCVEFQGWNAVRISQRQNDQPPHFKFLGVATEYQTVDQVHTGFVTCTGGKGYSCISSGGTKPQRQSVVCLHNDGHSFRRIATRIDRARQLAFDARQGSIPVQEPMAITETASTPVHKRRLSSIIPDKTPSAFRRAAV